MMVMVIMMMMVMVMVMVMMDDEDDDDDGDDDSWYRSPHETDTAAASNNGEQRGLVIVVHLHSRLHSITTRSALGTRHPGSTNPTLLHLTHRSETAVLPNCDIGHALLCASFGWTELHETVSRHVKDPKVNGSGFRSIRSKARQFWHPRERHPEVPHSGQTSARLLDRLLSLLSFSCLMHIHAGTASFLL